MLSRRTLHLLAAGLFLAGCASTSERMAEKGIEPMTDAEIQAMLPGNTLYQNGGTWEWVGYYRDDGTVVGKAWWQGGEETASGTWEVSDQGHVCDDWENSWGGGGYGCSAWYRDGDSIAYQHVSGSVGSEPEGTMTLKPGNPYNL